MFALLVCVFAQSSIQPAGGTIVLWARSAATSSVLAAEVVLALTRDAEG